MIFEWEKCKKLIVKQGEYLLGKIVNEHDFNSLNRHTTSCPRPKESSNEQIVGQINAHLFFDRTRIVHKETVLPG